MDLAVRASKSQRVTLIGGVKNIFLALIKIIFGITGHSHPLFADGIHSLSDLLIDVLVLLASRFGSKAADHEHPYGHGRIETAATLLLALILSLAGFGIVLDAIYKFAGLHTVVRPDVYVLIVAVLSIIINEVLYRYTKNAGEKVQSKLLITNAWHHRSDSVSSLVVLIGVLGAWFGFAKLDVVAAIIVGLMIVKMAWQFGWSSIRELIDTGLDDATLIKIRKVIVDVAGVRALHQLRTRSLAGKIFLDVHIIVDPLISVSEGHFIGQQVHYQLLKAIPDITDVTVHVDPENDEIVAPSRDLPARAEIIKLLQSYWQDLIDNKFIEKIVLHYVGGKVYVELCLPFSAENLAEQLKKSFKGGSIITKLTISFY